jgi:hypothetical protein
LIVNDRIETTEIANECLQRLRLETE